MNRIQCYKQSAPKEPEENFTPQGVWIFQKTKLLHYTSTENCKNLLLMREIEKNSLKCFDV